jgi:hypothetical protein
MEFTPRLGERDKLLSGSEAQFSGNFFLFGQGKIAPLGAARCKSRLRGSNIGNAHNRTALQSAAWQRLRIAQNDGLGSDISDNQMKRGAPSAAGSPLRTITLTADSVYA